MKIEHKFIALLFLFLLGRQADAQSTFLIPQPAKYEVLQEVFILNSTTSVVAEVKEFVDAAHTLKELLLKFTGIPASGKNDSTTRIVLKKELKNSEDNAESYGIIVNNNQVIISSHSTAGIYNGISTFLQLAIFGQEDDASIIKGCKIKDQPEFHWRGIMFDESRHFFGTEVVKQIIDNMFLLKLNRFHWHLTDSQGWRLEIKKYPKLSLVGGIGDNSDSLAVAKYYTQTEISEIVSYAKQRNIEVIPEIDMPGHATAGNRAYPKYSGGSEGAYPNFTFNPGKKETYTFLTNILKEVSVLFPARIIHLGGDEVSFSSKNWNQKKEILQLMESEKLKDIRAVEGYFLEKMGASALNIFDTIMAWDEAADFDLPRENTILFWWRHDKPEQLKKALDKGYRVILSPRIPLYFDFVQDESHLQGRKWKDAFSSVEGVYNYAFDPDNVMKSSAKGLIQGIQGNIWTEEIRSVQRLQYMIFPRIAALSEAAWTPLANRNYQDFLNKLKTHTLFYEKEGIHHYDPNAPGTTPEIIDLNIQQ